MRKKLLKILNHFSHLKQKLGQTATPDNKKQIQLLFDVSAISRYDMRSGIERVARAQLQELINIAPDTIRVEPVYLCEEGGLHYRYARKYARKILGSSDQTEEKPVDVCHGDLFHSADFYRDGVIQAAKAGIYTRWSSMGVTISFVVYDLLPIQHPEFFPEGTKHLHTQWLEAIIPVSDTLICISQTVADDLEIWMGTHIQPEICKKIQITAVHLGFDIKASFPSRGLPDDLEHILAEIKQRPTFLMVGTIEPRKGHLQTIKAFDLLWNKGTEVNLVIIGSEGWKGLPSSQRRTIPEIIQKIHKHPRLDKNLFWLEGISDLFLEQIYKASTALIAASENEGFGLPLIEAAHFSLPIIARDIAVFREVASDHAFYFSNAKDPQILADAITAWLEAHRQNKHIPSETMPCITWKKSARKTLEALSKRNVDIIFKLKQEK